LVAGAGQASQFDQASEPGVIAAVWRGGEQQRAPRTTCDLMAHVVAIGIPAHRVRLIDHHEVPRIARQRIGHMALFQKIGGRDPDAWLAPRVVADGAGLRSRVEPDRCAARQGM
jgi:hypothetical protein